jgi:phenylpropionate dioxygenase-like ring-hydroxylating dioxygenase large terminal subunit
VHWEAQNNRFFCPCHNGVFTPEGKATSGPPADAGQSLFRFPLKVENDLLFIEVSTDKLAALQGGELQAPGGPPGPGHDPCLYASNRQPREC